MDPKSFAKIWLASYCFFLFFYIGTVLCETDIIKDEKAYLALLSLSTILLVATCFIFMAFTFRIQMNYYISLFGLLLPFAIFSLIPIAVSWVYHEQKDSVSKDILNYSKIGLGISFIIVLISAILTSRSFSRKNF
jgi:hypothetical protein